MIIKPLIGPYGKMPILIRDDDTNFFTRADMLDSVHSKSWDKGFKVSLSVVPFQIGMDDVCVPPEMRKTGLLYSISHNENLIRFLRDKLQRQLIEILQHGFSHSIAIGYRGEFGINTPYQESNLKLGRDTLGQTFGVIPTFFVPPYDDISYKNLKLVRQQGMLPIYGQEKIHKLFRSRFMPGFYKRRVAKQIFNKYGKSAFIVPVDVNPVINNNNSDKNAAGLLTSFPSIEGLNFEKVVSSDTFLDSLSKIILFGKSNRCMTLCMINHYHHYFYDWSSHITRNDMFRLWQQVLACLDNLSFGWKTTFSELYNRAKRVHKINISNAGSKITIESDDDECIENFSFQINGELEPPKNASNVLFEEETKIVTIEQVLPKSKIVLHI